MDSRTESRFTDFIGIHTHTHTSLASTPRRYEELFPFAATGSSTVRRNFGNYSAPPGSIGAVLIERNSEKTVERKKRKANPGSLPSRARELLVLVRGSRIRIRTVLRLYLSHRLYLESCLSLSTGCAIGSRYRNRFILRRGFLLRQGRVNEPRVLIN